MERVIKTVYTTLYQKTTGVSYKEQIMVTVITVGFILAIIIPLLGLLFL